MSTLSRYVPAKKWPGRKVNSNIRPVPQVLDFRLSKMKNHRNADRSFPSSLLMIRINEEDPGADQLYLDHIPVPRESWSFDKRDRVLCWHGAYGGGRIKFSYDSKTCSGAVGEMNNTVNIAGGAKVQFTCQVALDAGVAYLEEDGVEVSISYDPTSPEWKSADWGPDRLRMTYWYQESDQPQFIFQDLVSEADPWVTIPFMTSVSLQMQPLSPGSVFNVWDLMFQSIGFVPEDDGKPTTGPNSVYPYWLVATEDPAATMIVGGMLIDDVVDYGTLIGMQGYRTSVFINGYYRTSSTTMAFGIFDGRMMIDGKEAGNSRIKGNTLFWNGLSPEIQQQTGLPASGSLTFNQQGSKGINKTSNLQAYRLNAAAATESIRNHPAQYVHAGNTLQEWNDQLNTSNLSITGLLLMTPYKFDPDKKIYYDAVQAEVTDSLGQIMNAYIDPDMWKLLFPGTPQPTLSGDLRIIAESPVPGVDDPTLWYQKLSAAVLTQGMSDGNDQNCKNMNGPRAEAWLTTEVSTSKVYYTHGQELFQMKWKEANPTFQLYLDDQRNNAEAYNVIIDQKVSETKDDILNTVITNEESDPDMIDTMIADTEAAGEYAKANQLYWAFAYYNYNTQPNILNNIATELGAAAGNHDASVLTRSFQTNVAVLTALDPSGFFARQYNTAINVFMCTNILPLMYGFTGQDGTYSLIEQYLQEFVKQNINNKDEDIRQAAEQLEEMIQADNYPQMLADTIDAMQAFADTIDAAMAFPYVAQKLVNWFQNAYPVWAKRAENFCGAVTTGIMGLSIYNLYYDFRKWSELTTEERTELISNTVQLGIQVIGGMVKRGVRLYAVFSSQGMELKQGMGAVWKVFGLGKQDAERVVSLDESINNLGSSFAKWLGGTEGSFSKMLAAGEISETTPLLADSMNVEEEVSWMYKILGRNLDEFISARLGPVFIIAGMGFSIWKIVDGDSGLELVGDILNLVAGSLMLMATVGAMITEGVLATILCCAGPLAILVALAGVGLMLYQVFHKKPDPVAQFVNDYCKPAGFYVPSKCTAIDYATPYPNPDKDGLVMKGCALSNNGISLRCTDTGLIGTGQNNYMPDFVWFTQTDGQGMTQIYAYTQPAGADQPMCYYLSLMSDNTICFHQSMKVKDGPDQESQDDASVVTQTWLSNTFGNAVLTGDEAYLYSLQLNLQPVIPKDGNYDPSQANGYIRQADDTVVYDENDYTIFQLTMCAIAPNYMKMVDLSFRVNNRTDKSESWGPTFGVSPSRPVTWANQGELPPFLTFDSETGLYTATGDKVTATYNSNNTVSVSNAVGSGSANFSIAAVDPRKVPDPVAQLAS